MAKREELEADILFVCVKVLKAREKGDAVADGLGDAVRGETMAAKKVLCEV